MKNIFLNLFIATGLVAVTTSCSNDDDNSDLSNEELTISIDGGVITFNTIDVDVYTGSNNDGTEFIEYEVTATIDNSTEKIIEFGLDAGDTGSNAIHYFNYKVNGIDYNAYSSSDFVSVVSVNDGSNITATFSGELTGYNEEIGEEVSITIVNGSVSVDF